MELTLPDSLSALRKEVKYTKHRITLDPNAFRAIIQDVTLNLTLDQKGAEFRDHVGQDVFNEMMPSDPLIYGVGLDLFPRRAMRAAR
jgi:hypothetical protein